MRSAGAASAGTDTRTWTQPQLRSTSSEASAATVPRPSPVRPVDPEVLDHSRGRAEGGSVARWTEPTRRLFTHTS